VVKILPRSHPCLNLYEISMDEETFKASSKACAGDALCSKAGLTREQATSQFLTHAEVEGVYELGVPLAFRIISKLGHVLTPFPTSL
jgi:hypothetical protein